MVAKMKNEKNSLVLLSSKRTKADTRTRADEAFALPSFPEATPMFQTELPPQSCKEVAMEHHHDHHGKVLENLKQTMLQHEAMFKEQVRELHRLYQVQRLLMAASKGKVINKSSDPASSNSSIVNSSDFLKHGGDRGALEAVSGSKISFMQKYQELASTPGQFTPPDHQMQGNTAQEGVQHLEEIFPSKCHKKAARRRTFDLERPAEEYIDVDYGEEKSPEGDSPPTMTAALKVSHSTGAFINQSPGKDARWSPSMGGERETVDTVCRGTFGKLANVAEENGADNHFLFQRPISGEVSSFPLLPSKLDCPSNEALVFPTPVLSTKSLLGGLLGQKHEGQLEDKMVSDMQRRHSAEHKERKVERQFSEPETDHRTIQENSTAPQWLLQGQAAPIKNLPSPALTQNLGWHQPLPFFLQKQEDLDLPRKNSSISEERTSASVSQEQTKAGKTWSNNGTSYPGQMLAMGMQGMPSSSLSPTGSALVPYRIFPQVGESSSQSIPVLRDDKGAHLFPVFMSNHTSVPAVDMHSPDPETHAASMMFPLGFNSRGIVHGPSTQPWFQVNGFSSPMQQQQVAKFKSGSLPLAGEKSLPGDYKVEGAHSFGSASIFGSNLHGHFKVTDDVSYSIMHSVPSTARPEVPPQETVFGNNTTSTDVELTLGVCTNKVKKDPCCFGQPTVKQEQFDRLPFMGDGFERKPQTGKFQPGEIQSFLSEACTGDVKIKATHNGFEHGIETAKRGLFEYTSINVLQLGLSQKVTDVTVTEGKGLISPDALNIKEALHQQRNNQFGLSKVIAGQKQGQNFYLNAVEDPTEQLRVHDVSEAVGECNNGNSGNERALIQHRKWTVSDTECAFSGGAADRPFDRVNAVGETIMPGRSSGVPSVTSCEIGETIPMSIWNPSDEANLGCGEACQSHESECANYESEHAVVAPSSHMQNAAEICEGASVQVRNHCDEYTSPILCNALAVFNSDKENDVLRANSQDHGDDRESDNSRKHEDDVSDHSNQAAEILLSLTSGLSCGLEEEKVTEDYAEQTKERSLEWFANVIPREDESVITVGNKDATAGFQALETFEGVRSAFEQLGEATSRNSERSVQDRLKEVQSPKKLDFFETVTLMLKASGLDTDEMNLQAIDKWQLEGECQSVAVHSGRPSRRGRVGKDFQREMLPSIASLSRQEITEDIQTLGGLVRSATEMVAKRSASCLPLKEENSCTPRGLDSINHGGTKGLCMNLVTKSSRKDEMENQNGFLRISSWGELTRRRRMRRHRSHWSLLPLGIGLSSP